jgi:hypothetical protein
MGAPGFDDLVAPPLQFKEFSVNELLSQRGGLKYTQPIYARYNDALRELASTYQKTAAEIDLILWAHSIRKQPFRAPDHQTFTAHFMLTPKDRKHLKGGDRSLASRIVDAYLASLKDVGYLRRERLIEVLRSVFALIRDECKTFGRKERSKAVRHTANGVVARLNEAINSGSPDRLLARWAYLQAMVDTTSSGWTGSTTLPGSMCLKGYLVFEDFVPIKQYLEELYDRDNLEPRTLLD